MKKILFFSKNFILPYGIFTESILLSKYSIYLSNKYEHLDKYCYLSWSKKTWKNIKPYEEIISKLKKQVWITLL